MKIANIFAALLLQIAVCSAVEIKLINSSSSEFLFTVGNLSDPTSDIIVEIFSKTSDDGTSYHTRYMAQSYGSLITVIWDPVGSKRPPLVNRFTIQDSGPVNFSGHSWSEERGTWQFRYGSPRVPDNANWLMALGVSVFGVALCNRTKRL